MTILAWTCPAACFARSMPAPARCAGVGNRFRRTSQALLQTEASLGAPERATRGPRLLQTRSAAWFSFRREAQARIITAELDSAETSGQNRGFVFGVQPADA